MEENNTVLIDKITEALSDKRAQDIVVMDLTEGSAIAEIFIMATANSDVHMKTLAEAASRVLGEEERMHIAEGKTSNMWQLIDSGDLVVHIFSSKGREFYNLERVWGDYPVTRVEDIENETENHLELKEEV